MYTQYCTCESRLQPFVCFFLCFRKQSKKGDSRGSREDKAYQRLLTTNAHGVRSSLTKLSQQEKNDDCELLGVIVHTHYQGHQQVLDQEISDKWYKK